MAAPSFAPELSCNEPQKSMPEIDLMCGCSIGGRLDRLLWKLQENLHAL
jgi:hypothetical protein